MTTLLILAHLAGCADIDPSLPLGADHGDAPLADLPAEVVDTGEVTEPQPWTTTIDEATDTAIRHGVDPKLLIYKDLLPFRVHAGEAQMEWGFIEQTEAATFMVTFVSAQTGELLALRSTPSANILAFLDEIGLSSDVAYGSTPGDYDSFPWGWRLPFEATASSRSAWMTYGHGCGLHSGYDAYATDWDPGDEGHLLESPASCWVTSTSYSSSYGNQVVAECGDAGSGRRYYFRVAHLRDTPLVSVGTWAGKGRNLGYMGSTGYSTAPHVHFVVYRGTMSGSRVTSGGSLPISRWPSTSDGLCDGDLSAWSFATCSALSIGRTYTDGCP
ncbi:M23 family metallopeptidase [Myxococcota bacterium]|nr:M23 family metallopeptidase [Myxococcota bacterium]